MQIGALYQGNGCCRFRVWAPYSSQVQVKLISPKEKTLSMQPLEQGYWQAEAEDVFPGALYYFLLDNRLLRPDPASHHQPQGVHGPSEVLNHLNFSWEEDVFKPPEQSELILYELHPGTFTQEGTLFSAQKRLDHLIDLGINALNLMPVAQFPGSRNWGYDGVFPFTVQNTYGGPQGLKSFVQACHKKGLALILDVVYNHLGPEGNYLHDFGPYFTDKYSTPWGPALNFDLAQSDEVRNFFLQNALHWMKNYALDGLRLDAVHGIFDQSAKPFLQELAQTVESKSKETGKSFYLFPESDLNDARLLRPQQENGYGLHAQWCDDFHHSLYTLLTGESQGYYQDFSGLKDLAKSWRQGYVYDWKYSRFRLKRHGSPEPGLEPKKFIVYSQNHDQVGNRMLGDRLSQIISFEGLKLAAGAVLLSPFLPLLFMGEEFAARTPFPYFISHSDQDLIQAVQEGRKKEFADFDWPGAPLDPQDPKTFNLACLNWTDLDSKTGESMLAWYRTLTKLRKNFLRPGRIKSYQVLEHSDLNCLEVFNSYQDELNLWLLMNFKSQEVCLKPEQEQRWEKLLDSADPKWQGQGSSLPERIEKGHKLKLAGYGLGLYYNP